MKNTTSRPSGLLLILAFTAVYIIWGTTYLAMRFGLLGLKPFVLSTLRYGLATVGLFALIAIKGLALPSAKNVRIFAISGLLMLVGGTGLVVTGEQYINSGATAVIIATEPILFLFADRTNRRAYNATTLLGIALGFAGIFLFSHYTGSSDAPGSSDVLKGSILVFISTLFWVAGTLYARKATVAPAASATTVESEASEPGRSPSGRALRFKSSPSLDLRPTGSVTRSGSGLSASIPNAASPEVAAAPAAQAPAEAAPTSPIVGMAIQHLAAAAASLFIAIMSGQWQTFHPGAVPGAAYIGLAYLVIFGTFIAFTAFMWLMKVQPPAIVSTHTYVNPVVAVIAGWLLAGETIGIPQLLALVLVLLGIVLVQSPRKLNGFPRRLFLRRPAKAPRCEAGG
ncbi:EamA family transporter [Puia dinghuensis]|uniref:EamA domain-containing protein n=1 Tax=Puia dinghuensis TaxID=1792502 RepID=A0A8J2UIV3_9BACT|nr:EamA family transporter [Puia dinghuensis]GGB24652.1 hypothetical protein GCM10011511_55750 [Puia dinghuensis]